MSNLERIRKGHRRALRWLKAHPGQKMPSAIQQGLNEFAALEELRLQQQSRRLMEEWERDPRPIELKGPPPLPQGRQVVLPPRLAKGLLLALGELNDEEKADAPVAA